MELNTQENERLQSLYSYQILDSKREEAYDNLTELASQLCNCPYAFISFIDKDRQWLKSSFHLPPQYKECPREYSFCTRTIEQTDTIIIEDTLKHDFYKDHQQVVNEPHVRFYAGVPIINEEGYALGSLCVIDSKPNQLNPTQLSHLERIASLVRTQLELNRNLRTQTELNEKQTQATQKVQDLIHNLLPNSIIEELKEAGHVTPHYYESASIVFSKLNPPEELKSKQPATMIKRSDQFFNILEDFTQAYALEKIKTNGDQLMAVSGVPVIDRAHAIKACLSALSYLKYQRKIQQESQLKNEASLEFNASFSIHSGSVIAGVIGENRCNYDLWGDSVNVAARILAGTPFGEIRTSHMTYHLTDQFFEYEDLGNVQVKNMPPIHIYKLLKIRPEYAYDAEGLLPNESFMKYIETL